MASMEKPLLAEEQDGNANGSAGEYNESSSLDVDSGKEDERRSPPLSYTDNEGGSGGDGGSWLSCFDLGFSQAGKTGTYWGMALLMLTMIASVVSMIAPPESQHVQDIWKEGCPEGFAASCLANQAVLRFTMALVVLFGGNLILTCASCRTYDEQWLLKAVVFAVMCASFYYAPAHVFNILGFAWFARVGGFLFMLLQQIILLDFALSWNENWLQKARDDGDGPDGRNRWKIAILGVGVAMMIGSWIAIHYLYRYFAGSECSDNVVIVTLTLVLSLLGLLFQIICTRVGSVLTSGVMACYYVYIAFSAVTLNPLPSCNPTLSSGGQTATTAIGLCFTILSLGWTCYSTIRDLPAMGLQESMKDDSSGSNPYAHDGLHGILINVCVIFILGTCYFAMVLTNWATQQSAFTMGNARVGETAMWLQASAGWCCFLMYIWALFAPMVWPERFGLEPAHSDPWTV